MNGVGFNGLSRENYINSLVTVWKEEAEKKTYKYDDLTEDDKKDLITVDGHTYIRKMYEGGC